MHCERLGQGEVENDRAEQIAFHRDADRIRFDNRVDNPFVRQKEIALARLVAEHVPLRHARVLEVGCGEGSNLWFLRRERPECRLIGVDLSIAKLRFLRSIQPAVRGIAADALQLPFREKQFDTVILRDLLHHVNWNRAGVVAECLQVLKSGGMLIVLEGDGTTVFNRVFQALYPVERGMKDSSATTLGALLSRHGEPSLQFVEASSAVRAAGFLVGWPRGLARIPASAVYVLASCWERVAAALLPRRHWVYMLATLRRP